MTAEPETAQTPITHGGRGILMSAAHRRRWGHIPGGFPTVRQRGGFVHYEGDELEEILAEGQHRDPEPPHSAAGAPLDRGAGTGETNAEQTAEGQDAGAAPAMTGRPGEEWETVLQRGLQELRPLFRGLDEPSSSDEPAGAPSVTAGVLDMPSEGKHRAPTVPHDVSGHLQDRGAGTGVVHEELNEEEPSTPPLAFEVVADTQPEDSGPQGMGGDAQRDEPEGDEMDVNKSGLGDGGQAVL